MSKQKEVLYPFEVVEKFSLIWSHRIEQNPIPSLQNKNFENQLPWPSFQKFYILKVKMNILQIFIVSRV